MKKSASRIAVDASSGGRWYPNPPPRRKAFDSWPRRSVFSSRAGVCNFQPPREGGADVFLDVSMLPSSSAGTQPDSDRPATA